MKKIRLWKLGSLENHIIPSKDSIETLKKLIDEKVGIEDDVVNIVWGPDLTIEEYTGDSTLLKTGRIGFQCPQKVEEKKDIDVEE